MMDVRKTPTRSLAKNPTVIQTLIGWSGDGTITRIYIYGDGSLVVPTMNTLMAIQHESGEPRLKIEAVLPQISAGPAFVGFGTMLKNWYGIVVRPPTERIMPTADDLVIIMDIGQNFTVGVIERTASLLSRAKNAGSKIIIVTKDGMQLPRQFFDTPFTGSVNDYLNVFDYQAIETVAAGKNPGRIIIGGRGNRVVASAIGAVDFLARFSDETNLWKLADRVIVDGSISSFEGEPKNVKELFSLMGIPFTENPLADAVFEPTTDKVRITGA